MEKKTEQTEVMSIPQIQLFYVSGKSDGPKVQIKEPHIAYEAFKQSWNARTIELVMELKVMYLNNAAEVLGIYPVSSGGREKANIDPRVIFAGALIHAATNIIVCVNHPSGKLEVSEQTRAFANKLKNGGKLLEIELTDFLVISQEGYKSFTEIGLL